MLTNQLRERESYDNMDNNTSHERAYKFRFYPDATQDGTIESMNKNDYHTISASNDNIIHAERKPQDEPVKQDTPFTELMVFRIILLNTLIAIIISTVFNTNIIILAYLTASVIASIGFIVNTWFQ